MINDLLEAAHFLAFPGAAEGSEGPCRCLPVGRNEVGIPKTYPNNRSF